MRWKGRQASRNVEDRRGRRPGGGLAIGGIGTIVIVIIVMLMGGDPRPLLEMVEQSSPPAQSQTSSPPADDETAQFAATVLGDTERVWGKLFEERGAKYRPTRMVYFSQRDRSACGIASSGMGPFYCPADQSVYIDLTFFNELSQRFGYKGIYVNYDSEVLARYAAWIVERGKQDDVLLAIDVHTPINAKVAEIRKTHPKFTMSGDGVHVDREGHRMIAAALLDGLGYEDVDLSGAALAKIMPLVSQRQKLRHAAWVSHVGHKRPGVKPGKPIDEAEKEAADLTKQIEAAAGTK